MHKNLNTAPRMEEKPGFDLLQIRWIRAAFFSPLIPYIFQATILVLFIWLAVIGWRLFAPEGVASKQFAKTNIVNLMVWGLWWPAMVWLAVLCGRLWCSVCPLELVANLSERAGRLLAIKQMGLKRWLQAGVFILFFYATIQMLVAGAELHRVPAYTSIFLWTLLGLAALVGLLFRDRAFCRAFCPVGLLLNVYGRGSLLAVRAKSSDTCTSCPGKDCIQARDRTRWDQRSCPSLLNPSKLNDNADCLICGQCTTTCPSSNVGIYLRRPFHSADTRERLASWPLTLFVMLVSGFVTYELFSEWKAAQSVFLWVPTTITGMVGASEWSGWIKGTWMLIVVPLLLWLVFGSLVLGLHGARSMGEAWRRLAMPMAIILAAGHMSKGLAKFVSWGGYLPGALREPTGTETALAIASGASSKPTTLMPLALVSVIALTLLAIMGYFALRESRLTDPKTHLSRGVPLVLALLASAVLLFGWGYFG